MTEFDFLTKRVAKLEHENRLFKLAEAGVTLGAIVLLSIGAVKSPEPSRQRR
jgi:hypothetical protein